MKNFIYSTYPFYNPFPCPLNLPLINHNFSWESKLNDTGVGNKTFFFFWKHRMEPVNYQPENYRFCLEVLEMTHMTEGSSCLRYYDALPPKIDM